MMYAMDNNLSDTIAFEAQDQVAAFNSYDLKEGVTAFIQKRLEHLIGLVENFLENKNKNQK